jgi:hypothetical protein
VLEQSSRSPSSVKEVLQNSATPGEVGGNLEGGENRLLFSYHSWAWISGPGLVTTTGDIAFTQSTVGGGSSWTYIWEESIDGGAYTTVGTGTSYTKTITANDCYQALVRLTPTTAGESFVVIHDYTVSVAGMCPL